jgi:ribosomal protein S18 acetylase RimI-like enzyme
MMKQDSLVIALDGKIPIGIMRSAARRDNPEQAWLFAVYVNKEYRRQGIASMLLDKCIGFVKNTLHLKKITLHVNESEESAIQLYKNKWFVDKGMVTNDDGQQRIDMELIISEWEGSLEYD